MRTTPSRGLPAGSPWGTHPLEVNEAQIAGYESNIQVRLYRRAGVGSLPVMLYFHGGAFVGGSLDDGDLAARHFAEHLPVLVISVGYSLAPKHPFPAALEDAYRAARWAEGAGKAIGGDGKRLFAAGHCAGGHVANGLAFMARDRGDVRIGALAMFSPMLDPSMTCLADERIVDSDISSRQCLASYRAYLPKASQRMHPYAAPLESARLAGLPPMFIATARNDVLHVEAETYAARLIGAGVPTQVMRYSNATHERIAYDPQALQDASRFFECHLRARAVTAG
ncbi:alpha/beta hydrolase [Trinickia dinghuensis]|uniref:Alpha/beta hydrolase n=1 Tax=Trinickia dinghuensis TaxID=2291023 RepID=A0A3D8K0S2_9BURK|nr:alpha/beta hydrolase [Trinickia dinghuensis]RDU99057.1 alpha/beta hydrolase [Trinickia dinghuensis]